MSTSRVSENLSLYIHIPWCIQKCPYCDFNSHKKNADIDEDGYVNHLIADLKQDLIRYEAAINGRKLSSIFIGGGTPSLFSVEAISTLLRGVEKRIAFMPDIEITIEANPGASERSKFLGYVQEAGVNRISLGVQSFNDDALKHLGRIHNSSDALHAIEWVNALLNKGLRSFNLDVMHGLPNQTLSQGLYDLQKAIECSPPHLSWYQLTIEPNTLFASRPPRLPHDDLLWDIFDQGHKLLSNNGYQHYETSAYAKEGFQCQHNLNYWRFGDYLAIGCGAHGKITNFNNLSIERMSKTKHPRGYQSGQYLDKNHLVPSKDLPFEFFMNRLRLLESFHKEEFSALTGLPFSTISATIATACEQNLLTLTNEIIRITPKGKLFLNDLLTLFLD